MASALIHAQAKKGMKPRPEIRTGFTVRVHQKVEEGSKTRIQIFEGLVIGVHRGKSASDHTITVRRIASGIGVEKVFSVHSPIVEKIEVIKVAKVRRAKLNFLRGRTGKRARLSERFTNANEFAVAAPPVEEEAAPEEAPKESAADAPVEEKPAAAEETPEAPKEEEGKEDAAPEEASEEPTKEDDTKKDA